MDLWIRSQNRLRLVIANNLSVGLDGAVYNAHDRIGTYKTIDRALEVIDEIQKRLAGASKIISQAKIAPISNKPVDLARVGLANGISFVPDEFDCLAVNQSVVVYKMPKE